MVRRWNPARSLARRPARAVVVGFAVAVAVGTALLMLPLASESGEATGVVTGVVTALFTATSAVCLTGLIVADTPDYSTYGELVILGLILVGGLGIMTLASLLGLLIARRMGLRLQLSAQAETKSLGLGEVRRVVGGVVVISLGIEAAVAVPLVARFAAHYDEPPSRALYLGVFHALSAFNNAGFALSSNSMMRFATGPWICLPMIVAVVLGGIGFPVLFALSRRLRGGPSAGRCT